MILSIDRVLQLLAEGKDLEKIAEISKVKAEDVSQIIGDARNLLLRYEKIKTRKKVIFKTNKPPLDTESGNVEENNNTNDNDDIEDIEEILRGTELSAIPFNSFLLMYTDGAAKGNPGPAGIGISIHDKDDRVVGKVSHFIGTTTNNVAEYSALIRALKIAIYFKTKELKIRTDSELAVKQIKGEYRVTSDNIRHLYEEVMKLKSKINSCRIEHVTRNLNEKADYLAKKAAEKYSLNNK